ncbi:MAG TPA: M48 family metallopeptidase [Longimicrobiales bacterium]
MDEPSQKTRWPGWYYDGRTARREPVTVMIGPGGIGLMGEDGRVRFWPFEELRVTQGAFAHEPVRLERGDEAPEAVVVDDRTFLSALRAAAPRHFGHFRQPRQLGRQARLAIAGTVAILGAALAGYLWGVPALAAHLADRVPLAWEERIGEQAAAELTAGLGRCEHPALQRAIEQMAAALARASGLSPDAFRFHVADDSLVNAFALPGGTIILFRGLIERAETPDELAGVLAHEMQHVALRHSTQALLRELPVRILIAGLTGDAPALGQALHAAVTLRSLHFSREAEREADRAAAAMLAAAGADPGALAAFLARLERQDTGVPAYFSTHPPTRERVTALATLAPAADPAAAWPSIADWKTIRHSCR